MTVPWNWSNAISSFLGNVFLTTHRMMNIGKWDVACCWIYLSENKKTGNKLNKH